VPFMSTKPDPAPGSEVPHKHLQSFSSHSAFSATLIRPFLPVPHLCPPSPAMGRRRDTATELLARVEANGYKKGEHKEKDVVRNSNKHAD
jgi:hypothetical protein